MKIFYQFLGVIIAIFSVVYSIFVALGLMTVGIVVHSHFSTANGVYANQGLDNSALGRLVLWSLDHYYLTTFFMVITMIGLLIIEQKSLKKLWEKFCTNNDALCVK